MNNRTLPSMSVKQNQDNLLSQIKFLLSSGNLPFLLCPKYVYSILSFEILIKIKQLQPSSL